jgi:hypothetical protein
MENINIELKEQDKKQKYRDYQREYHSNYRLQQRLEDGLIERKPMRKLKKQIGEYVETALQQKIIDLEKELRLTREKQLDFMKLVIKVIQDNTHSHYFHKLMGNLEDVDELPMNADLIQKLDYYEMILEDL